MFLGYILEEAGANDILEDEINQAIDATEDNYEEYKDDEENE
jgi:hypothetical protein